MEELETYLNDRLVDFSRDTLQPLASSLADAMLVAHGTGMIDASHAAQKSNDRVALAEGIDPVMGFAAAIKALRSKVPVPTERWDELSGEYQSWAFTVAGVMQSDILLSIQEALTRVLEGELTLDEFRATAGARKTLSASRADLVYVQNVSNAYAAGQWEAAQDPDFREALPYCQYEHGGSERPRPHHLATDKKVWRTDDPIWQSIYPPNGFACSCTVSYLSAGQLSDEQLSLSDPLPLNSEQAPSVRVGGNLRPVAEKGFSHPPGLSHSKEETLRSAKERLPAHVFEALMNADF